MALMANRRKPTEQEREILTRAVYNGASQAAFDALKLLYDWEPRITGEQGTLTESGEEGALIMVEGYDGQSNFRLHFIIRSEVPPLPGNSG